MNSTRNHTHTDGVNARTDAGTGKVRWVVMPRGHNRIDAVQVWPEQDGLGRICTITNGSEQYAQLIAAAPELLAVAQAVIAHQNVLFDVSPNDYCSKCKVIVEQAHAAIARAEGRTP